MLTWFLINKTKAVPSSNRLTSITFGEASSIPVFAPFLRIMSIPIVVPVPVVTWPFVVSSILVFPNAVNGKNFLSYTRFLIRSSPYSRVLPHYHALYGGLARAKQGDTARSENKSFPYSNLSSSSPSRPYLSSHWLPLPTALTPLRTSLANLLQTSPHLY